MPLTDPATLILAMIAAREQADDDEHVARALDALVDEVAGVPVAESFFADCDRDEAGHCKPGTGGGGGGGGESGKGKQPSPREQWQVRQAQRAKANDAVGSMAQHAQGDKVADKAAMDQTVKAIVDLPHGTATSKDARASMENLASHHGQRISQIDAAVKEHGSEQEKAKWAAKHERAVASMEKAKSKADASLDALASHEESEPKKPEPIYPPEPSKDDADAHAEWEDAVAEVDEAHEKAIEKWETAHEKWETKWETLAEKAANAIDSYTDVVLDKTESLYETAADLSDAMDRRLTKEEEADEEPEEEEPVKESLTYPVWRYTNPNDAQSRPAHAARDGSYYPSSATLDDVRGTDPAEVSNCRCEAVPITASEWQRLAALGAALAEGYSLE